MNCDELKRSIYDYTENKLSSEARADFEQHRAECDACGSMLSEVMKLSCRDFVGFLNDYFEGELPNEQRATFDRHMELCPPCGDYLRSYKATVDLGRIVCSGEARPPEDVPEDLLRAIMRARGKTA